MSERLVEFSIKHQMITEVCAACSVAFAMPKELQERRYADKQLFYCPNGHSQAYQGQTEESKLRKKLDDERRERQRAEQRVAQWQDEAREAEARAEHERRRANGYKGHAAKITKRAKAGVCPCCNRHFVALERHMATKHPTFTPDAPEPLRVVQGGKS